MVRKLSEYTTQRVAQEYCDKINEKEPHSVYVKRIGGIKRRYAVMSNFAD